MKPVLTVLALALGSPAAAQLSAPDLQIRVAAAPARASELYLVGGKIFTADPERPEAEAVAIRDGKVVAVGDTATIRRLAADAPPGRVIELSGRRVIPGLIEAHGHAAPALLGRVAPMPNLPWPGPTPDEALAVVAQAATEGPGWIDGEIGPLVVNDPRDWRSALDAAAPNNPVMLRPWWGHGMLLNSAALRELKVADTTPDPLGGWYGRRPDGALDGRARELPEWSLMRRRAALVPPQATVEAYRQTADRYAGWGVTSYHHMMHNQPLADGLASLQAARPKIKWSVYGWAVPQRTPADAWAMFDGLGAPDPHIRVAGIKWVLDATPIERDAYLSRDYADRPGWRGRPNFPVPALEAILKATLANPQQPAFHIAGDAQLRDLLDAMERLASPATWTTRRVRVEHADGLTPDLIARARALGLVIVANPLHLDSMPDAKGMPMMRARLGERAASFQPMKSLVAVGVPFALGSDANGPPANPFLNMMLAVVDPSNPAEALTREQALVAYTRTAAYAEGQESAKGMIKPGLAADLAVLSQDILAVPLNALPATRSLLTLVDGHPVHAEAEFTAVREQASSR